MTQSYHKEGKFTIVPNSIITSSEISFTAKGVWAYIKSKPPGYEFAAYRICTDTKEGKAAVAQAIKELISAGYLKRHKLQSGRVRYTTCEPSNKPESQNPVFPNCGNPKLGNPQTEEIGPINNTEKENKTYIKNNTEKENKRKKEISKEKNLYERALKTGFKSQELEVFRLQNPEGRTLLMKSRLVQKLKELEAGQ